MINTPIIRIEIERMRHAIVTMVSQYETQFDQELREAVDRFCSEENIKRVIDSQVKDVLAQVIREEIKNFYLYGEGRKIVKDAVNKKLSNPNEDLIDLTSL